MTKTLAVLCGLAAITWGATMLWWSGYHAGYAARAADREALEREWVDVGPSRPDEHDQIAAHHRDP